MTKTTTVTLTEFLLARIAEDEELADRVEFRPYVGEGVPQSLQGRVLAECEAKRRIVESCRPVYPVFYRESVRRLCEERNETSVPIEAVGDAMWPHDAAEDTLRALASVYADHPDYDPSWA